LAIFSLVLMASVAAFIPTLKMVQSELSESGFLQFLSLAFSDFGIIAIYWQNFVMSLLETIPAMSFAILLVIIFVFLYSLKFLVRNIEILLSPMQLKLKHN